MKTIENEITNETMDNMIMNSLDSLKKNEKISDAHSIHEFIQKNLENTDITKEHIESRLLDRRKEEC